MIDLLVIILTKFLLFLRYDIKFIGLEEIVAKGKSGIVFLPNHPALIDPVILYTYLKGKFSPRGFGDQDQVDRFLIRFFAKRWGIRTIPSVSTYGPAAKTKIEQQLDESINDLKRGENLIVWSAGRIYRGRNESLGANSSVEKILQNCPDVRVVLIRTKGLWGSAFSWASGQEPRVASILRKALFVIPINAFFFTPRRKVTIEFYEPEDLPRSADRNTFNRFLENYYNADAAPNTYVPYTIWEKGITRTLPEQELPLLEADYASIPQATRQIVLKHLSEATGISQLKDTDRLAIDLGMDSLARTDLLLWLESEFGFGQTEADTMQTVGDVMLAACGRFVYITAKSIKDVEPRWFRERIARRVTIPDGDTLTEIFLRQAATHPSAVAIADQITGIKTYRDIVTACLVLKPVIEKIDGDHIGIMLPASATVDIFYLSMLFASKTPVMVNWTAGVRNITASLDSIGVKHILTAKSVVDRIFLQGIDLSAIADRFIYAEDIGLKISKLKKLKAFITSYITWRSLHKTKISETAVILFTSGSEALPKVVPLTHANIISNIRSVLSTVEIFENDCLIGFLPPFHSMGLTATILMPICGAVRTVYYPNPMDADMLAKIIESYKVTLLIGTPTFLGAIARVASMAQLSTLRLAVTGAEACQEKVYEYLKTKCKNTIILEGYGVTEASPIVSINDPRCPKQFTIGKVVPGLQYILVDPETLELRKQPCNGLLLVRGPSIFGGYLNYGGRSPFVEIDGNQWYSTGDLVSVDADGALTFKGRLKRFVKLGGEMVSLPAIEATLAEAFASEQDNGQVLAVEATEAESPELVLFTTVDIDRETANRKIREAGLSGLHNIRKVFKLDEMPLLGIGKINYQALKQMLRG